MRSSASRIEMSPSVAAPLALPVVSTFAAALGQVVFPFLAANLLGGHLTEQHGRSAATHLPR